MKIQMLLVMSLIGLVPMVQAQQVINPNITNETPDNRYTVNGDGTVTDTYTGLMWKQCSAGQSGSDCATGSATAHNWQQALQLAEADTTASYTDWRLPNREELRSLAAYDRYSPSINISAFPDTPSTFYWSSSLDASDGNSAWVLGFDSGYDNTHLRGNSYSVRMVRGGR